MKSNGTELRNLENALAVKLRAVRRKIARLDADPVSRQFSHLQRKIERIVDAKKNSDVEHWYKCCAAEILEAVLLTKKSLLNHFRFLTKK